MPTKPTIMGLRPSARTQEELCAETYVRSQKSAVVFSCCWTPSNFANARELTSVFLGAKNPVPIEKKTNKGATGNNDNPSSS